MLHQTWRFFKLLRDGSLQDRLQVSKQQHRALEPRLAVEGDRLQLSKQQHEALESQLTVDGDRQQVSKQQHEVLEP